MIKLESLKCMSARWSIARRVLGIWVLWQKYQSYELQIIYSPNNGEWVSSDGYKLRLWRQKRHNIQPKYSLKCFQFFTVRTTFPWQRAVGIVIANSSIVPKWQTKWQNDHVIQSCECLTRQFSYFLELFNVLLPTQDIQKKIPPKNVKVRSEEIDPKTYLANKSARAALLKLYLYALLVLQS